MTASHDVNPMTVADPSVTQRTSGKIRNSGIGAGCAVSPSALLLLYVLLFFLCLRPLRLIRLAPCTRAVCRRSGPIMTIRSLSTDAELDGVIVSVRLFRCPFPATLLDIRSFLSGTANSFAL
jgi:hypothetical protein